MRVGVLSFFGERSVEGNGCSDNSFNVFHKGEESVRDRLPAKHWDIGDMYM